MPKPPKPRIERDRDLGSGALLPGQGIFSGNEMAHFGASAGPFALLDDSGANGETPGGPCASSRLYTDLVHEHSCRDVAQLDQVCAEVEADLYAGLHAVVLADYEWGTALAGLTPLSARLQAERHLESQPAPQDPPPALRCMMFRHVQRLSAEQVDAWLAAREAGIAADSPGASSADLPPLSSASSAPPAYAGVMDLQASVTRPEFDAAIAGVHAALQAGDAYQINYTFRLDFKVYGSPVALYRRLRARQPVRYGALIARADQRWVLSCSPELFLDYHSVPGRLLARPMKGTAPRLSEASADREAGQALAQDPKNRAENLMIVDLLRNDLGRIAQTGSVRVPALFAVEGHPTVWQMTSSVEAQLRPETRFADVLRALFPCGSITGAPKHSAMQLIRELESTPRGLYTGAIGWLDAPAFAQAPEEAERCGAFCLSVAIRTLVLDAPLADSGGLRLGRMGVGAGIVLDSVAADEYDECYLKAQFLTGLDSGISLFETMYAQPETGVRHLERHLARLDVSARRLGFACDMTQVRAALHGYLEQMFADERGAALAIGAREFRVRLALSKSGQVSLSSAALQPLGDGPVKLVLAQDLGLAATDAGDALLGLKTTRRAHYDAGWQRAEQLGAFDALFVNTRGELTEGGRSNVFVKLAGRWWTPPLASGVLPGVMRAMLLADPQWSAEERRLTLDDLKGAEAVMVCNALRGALPGCLIEVP